MTYENRDIDHNDIVIYLYVHAHGITKQIDEMRIYGCRWYMENHIHKYNMKIVGIFICNLVWLIIAT